MAQQTAVEWLAEQLPIRIVNSFQEEIAKAKQMEKEQTMQDYDSGLFDGTMDDVNDRLYKNAEEYYNETYKKQ